MSVSYWARPEGREVGKRREDEPRPQADSWILLTVAALVVGGMIMVYSASSALGSIEHNNSAYFLERQVLGLVLGVVALVCFRRLDYHRLRQLAYPGAVVVLAMLILVLVPHLGHEANGARRWFSLGPLLLQPAELSKLSGILLVAAWIDRRADRLRDLRGGAMPFATMLAVAAILVMLERDLGTTTVLVLSLVGMFAIGGGRLSHTLCLLGGSVLGFVALSVAEPYRMHRLLAFANPWADPQNTGFQAVQSVLALGSGGLTGVGLGQSIQKYMWLPEAHTDFIFAIIGEEVGLVGTLAVLGAFAFLAYRGYRAAMTAPDHFGMLLAAGITTWFTVQALINVAAVTDSVPVTGIPLPFVSYGGTSLAACMAGVGILLNVSAQGQKVGLKREGFDIGWGHRRPHLPRPRRRAGA